MKEYTVYIDNSRAYIRVVIYKRVQQMRDRMTKDGKDHDKQCMGMFSPSNYYEDESGVRFYQDYIGMMYLHEDRLGSAVVAHECLHAAMSCERHLNRFTMKYDPDEINYDEERLCYLLSNIIKQVYTCIYDNEHAMAGEVK